MDMERVWKHFGKNTEAGKLLYQIYGVNYKPEDHINYPKLIIKKKTSDNIDNKKTKHKRAVTTEKVLNKISYPDLNKRNFYKPPAKIDLIAKRKGKNEIDKEIISYREETKRQPLLNPVTKNRKEIIEKLQDNFQYQEKKYLPEKANRLLPIADWQKNYHRRIDHLPAQLPAQQVLTTNRRLFF